MNETASLRFRRTREDHKTEQAEDYVELIDQLIEEFNVARVAQIATRLGVSPVTVSKTIKRLVREGLVVAAPYQSIKLTDEGLSIAKMARSRHQIVVRFLRSLGVPFEVAETDAEGIEHHVSPVTLEAMRKHLES